MSGETIATRLRQAREQKEKTHEQIHRETGFSLNVLQAVEAGNFKVVEPVYVRLILRAYAEYLGLDGDEIVQQYNDQFGAPLPGMKVPPAPVPPPHPQVVLGGEGGGEQTAPPPWQPTPLPRSLYADKPPPRLGLFAAGGVGLLLLLLLGVYWLDQEEEPPYAIPERSEVRAPAVPRPEPVPPRPVQPLVESQPQTEVASAAQISPGPDTTASRPAAPPPALSEPPPTAKPEPVPQPAAGSAPGGLVLELEAVEPTWVRIRWDRGGFLEAVLQPGTTRRLEARNQFLMWAGNSRGLRYRFQGQPIEQIRLGDPSHTVRFRASKEGVTLLDREAFEQFSEAARERDTTVRARRDSVP